MLDFHRDRYARAVRFAYLGNLVAVHFFTLAAPVILKARWAPMGTLPLFASLSLLWSLRFAIVPFLMARAGGREEILRPVRVLLVTRSALVVIFLSAAALTPLVPGVERLEALLLGAGVVVCLLAGVERGFLDAAAVLSSRGSPRSGDGRFPVYEAAGVVVGSTLTSGLVMAVSAELGVGASLLLAGGMVAALTIPAAREALAVVRGAGSAPGDRGPTLPDRASRLEGGAAGRGTASRLETPARFTSRLRRHVEDARRSMPLMLALLTLALGWLGIDLAYRVVQPMLLRQGASLGFVGAATMGTGLVLLAVFGATQLSAGRDDARGRVWDRMSYALPAAALALLCVASVAGRADLTVAGMVSLQVGYFFFSVFATGLAIRYGMAVGSPQSTVFISGASYVLAHVSLVPVLYLTTTCCSGFTMTCLVALGLLTMCILARFVLPSLDGRPTRLRRAPEGAR